MARAQDVLSVSTSAAAGRPGMTNSSGGIMPMNVRMFIETATPKDAHRASGGPDRASFLQRKLRAACVRDARRGEAIRPRGEEVEGARPLGARVARSEALDGMRGTVRTCRPRSKFPPRAFVVPCRIEVDRSKRIENSQKFPATHVFAQRDVDGVALGAALAKAALLAPAARHRSLGLSLQ